MSDLVNMSLDDIIRQSRNSRPRGRGGRSRARGRGMLGRVGGGGGGPWRGGGARSRSRGREARSRSRSQSRGPAQLRGRSQSRGRLQTHGRSQSRGRLQSRARSQSRGRSRSRSRSRVAFTPRSRVGLEQNPFNLRTSRGVLHNGLTTRGFRRRQGVASPRNDLRYGNIGLRSDRILAQRLRQQQRLSLAHDVIPSQVFTRSRSRSRSRPRDLSASRLTVSVRNDFRPAPQRRNSAGAAYLDGDTLRALDFGSGSSTAGSVRSRRSSALSAASAGSLRRGRGRGRARGGRTRAGATSQQVLNPTLQLQIAAIQRERTSSEVAPVGIAFRPVPVATATTLHQRFGCI